MIFAALFAPVIDRVYLGARDVSLDRIWEVYSRHHATPSLEMEFYFGLLTRPLPADALRAIANYREVNLLEDGIEEGVLTLDESGACALTPHGRELALGIQAAMGAGAAELWAHEPQIPLPRLNAYAGRMLRSGRHSGGPVFHAVSEVYEPEDASPEVRLTTRLGALRHHRADAHRAAWRSAGLTFAELFHLEDTALRQIEEDTDRRNTPLFSTLSDEERYELLGGLGALPN